VLDLWNISAAILEVVISMNLEEGTCVLEIKNMASVFITF
jgi:hypothetical protein